jgi:hyperosmotically inducible periplasmic protein
MKKALAAYSLALATAVGLGACASSQPENQRNAGEVTGDAAITAKVKSAIASDVGARTAAAVDVDTYRGVVQLSGFVDSQDQAQRAASAAQKVNGVKSVKNDLRLKS